VEGVDVAVEDMVEGKVFLPLQRRLSMRYLFAFLLAVLVSPCWAALDDDPKSPFYTPPEVKAARIRAAGECSSARVMATQLASQQAEEAEQREATTRTVAIVAGVVICVGILGYAISRNPKQRYLNKPLA
jgi:hypothetical protein